MRGLWQNFAAGIADAAMEAQRSRRITFSKHGQRDNYTSVRCEFHGRGQYVSCRVRGQSDQASWSSSKARARGRPSVPAQGSTLHLA